MIAVTEAFAPSYAKARARFLNAAQHAALPVRSFIQKETGLEGEELAIDVVLEGAPDAKNLLILSCGTQGANGFAGSGIETFLLHDEAWHKTLKQTGVAVLYVHVVDPWGMSHLAFADAENINFMRNFVDFSAPLPHNPGYASVHERAMIPAWEITAESEVMTEQIIAKHGIHFLLNIHQRGQHTHPDGFYYGGTHPCWAHQQWREILRTYGRQAARIAWVDLRRAWGVSSGQATLMANAPLDDDAAIARARAWWAPAHQAAQVMRPDEPQTMIPFGTGNPVISFRQECPQAQYTGLAAYFAAAESMKEMSFAARSSQWLRAQSQPSTADIERVHAMMREVSFKTDPAWQTLVIAQGRQIAAQAIAGLAQA